jgi:hypothetical protein
MYSINFSPCHLKPHRGILSPDSTPHASLCSLPHTHSLCPNTMCTAFAAVPNHAPADVHAAARDRDRQRRRPLRGI